MKLFSQISFVVLMWQWNEILCDPGLIDLKDLPDFRKTRSKTTVTTAKPSYNAITDSEKLSSPSSFKPPIASSYKPPTDSSFKPPVASSFNSKIDSNYISPIDASFNSIRITAEDVVTGSNSVYGSQQQHQQQMNGGGIIFAISQGQGSTSQPLMSAAQPQPVLMQYLSPQGTPHQSAIQYIQLLRPIMMVPASPYLPAKPQNIPQSESQPQTTPPPAQPKQNMMSPYGPYMRQSLVGSYSSPYASYLHSNPIPLESQKPAFDLGLNTNEYMPSYAPSYVPSASSQQFSVVAPRSSMTSSLSTPYAFRPTKFQTRAQRA